MTKKYGIFIGRFQPLHLGHMAVINEIIADGLRPVVIIGRPIIEKIDNVKYFLGYDDTFCQFEQCYKNTIIYNHVDDCPNDKHWIFNILSEISVYGNFDDCVLYYTNNPSDCNTNGVHYAEMFKDFLELKEATYPAKLGYTLRATDIRADIEGNRHMLDGRVYNYVKGYFIK